MSATRGSATITSPKAAGGPRSADNRSPLATLRRTPSRSPAAALAAIPGRRTVPSESAKTSIGAATNGEAGRTYLAFGAEDAQSTAAWLNLACEIAGVAHRVADVTIDPADADEAVRRYGATLVSLAQRSFPVPFFDNRRTRDELDYTPRRLREVLQLTIDWLRREGQLPT